MRLDFIPRMSVSTPGHRMTRCPECGWEIDPDDEMCPNCGAYLADYEDRARIPDDVDEVLQQLSLVAVDLLPREAFRLVLVDLRIQEPGIAHHAARIERNLEPKR